MIDDITGAANCGDESVVLNSIVNAKRKAKKLQFNLNKCVNMHIKPSKDDCLLLKIHYTLMKTIDNHKYLGDIISNSGNNGEKIKERSKFGFSAIIQIKYFLKYGGFGRFNVQSRLIMRD